MARRSTQKAVESASPPSRKRASSAIDAPTRRQSKRIKVSAIDSDPSDITPKKSKYFEPDTTEASSEAESDIENEESGYEDEDGSAVSSPAESDHKISASDSGEDARPTLKSRTGTKGSELWRHGVKTGLGPGKQVIVRLPKARPAGNTPYLDHTIHPNTLLFLKDLSQNNDREWLKMHDADFRTSEKDFDSFAAALTGKLIDRDETIPELPVKDIKFRIYRDIRFSPDPTPYKPYFSAAWSRTGRKGPYAGYYVQVQPGHSFIGGGLWHPDAAPLALLRRTVDRKAHKLKQTLMDPNLRKEFLGAAPADEKKVVKAFIGHNKESMLKTKPKGFGQDHPEIDLLRLRSYTLGKRLADSEVIGLKGLGRVAELLGTLTPLVTYLNSVVMPDAAPAQDSGSESDDEEDDTTDD
ncbi:MAG: hypothetical protein M1817_003754 [Caeruleum heppii]|nr:MAG: hypothetical protein M1817_003754 [Caeruleum heppii]